VSKPRHWQAAAGITDATALALYRRLGYDINNPRYKDGAGANIIYPDSGLSPSIYGNPPVPNLTNKDGTSYSPYQLGRVYLEAVEDQPGILADHSWRVGTFGATIPSPSPSPTSQSNDVNGRYLFSPQDAQWGAQFLVGGNTTYQNAQTGVTQLSVGNGENRYINSQGYVSSLTSTPIMYCVRLNFQPGTKILLWLLRYNQYKRTGSGTASSPFSWGSLTSADYAAANVVQQASLITMPRVNDAVYAFGCPIGGDENFAVPSGAQTVSDWLANFSTFTASPANFLSGDGNINTGTGALAQQSQGGIYYALFYYQQTANTFAGFGTNAWYDKWSNSVGGNPPSPTQYSGTFYYASTNTDHNGGDPVPADLCYTS